MLKCPICNSSSIITTGGERGNPFNRSAEKRVCGDCGYVYPSFDVESITVGAKIKVKMVSSCFAVVNQAEAEFPYVNATFNLSSYSYPISRFKQLVIYGDTISLDGETSKLTGAKLTTEKYYTVYAPDKHPEREKITIEVEILI